MSESFDPYRVWLGIPPESRPPTHYELLGISPREQEPAVIKAAGLRQSGYVRNFQVGKYSKDATQILNELAAALACLQDPVKRAQYDADLQARQVGAADQGQQNVPAAPVIDLDQLAATDMPLPAARDLRSGQRRPPRLLGQAGKRRSSGIPWYVPAAVAASVVVAAVAFALRPRGAETPRDDVSASSETIGGANDAADMTDSASENDHPQQVMLQASVQRVTAQSVDHGKERDRNDQGSPVVLEESAPASDSPEVGSEPATTAAAELLAGAVAWFRAEGNANDSARNHHGKLEGQAAFATARAGQVFEFDGKTGSVVAPDAPDLNPRDRFSLVAWINPTVTHGRRAQGMGIISKVSATPKNDGYQFWLADDRTELGISFNAPNEPWHTNRFEVRIDPPVPVNEWTHVAATYDGRRLTLYRDGNAVGSMLVIGKTVASSNATFRISGDDCGNCHFGGFIDDAAIFERALDAAEIATIYRGAAAVPVAVDAAASEAAAVAPGFWAGATAWYRADGNASDSSGTSHGTVKGGVKFAPGVSGKAFRFDESNGSIVFNGPFIFNRSGDASLTLCLRLTPPVNKGAYSLIWGRSDRNDINRFQIYLTADGALGMDYRSPSYALHTLFPGIQVGVRSFVDLAIVRARNVYSLYVNGAEVSTATDVAPDLPTADSWQLSGRPGAAFVGDVDEVAAFDRALSSAEIKSISRFRLAQRRAVISPSEKTLPAHLANAGTVDVLALIDPVRDAVSGSWSKDSQGLHSPADSPHSVLRLPVAVPEEYALDLSVNSAKAQDLLMALVGNGSQFVAAVGNGSVLQWLEGNAAHGTQDGRFQNGADAIVRCVVRRNGIQVLFDGLRVPL